MAVSAHVLATRYRLVSRIAAGGMGEVWRGEDLVLGRPVAVKLLREDYGQHDQTLARFRAEAKHASAISHPGIAQVYDYIEADGGHPPCLVLELVDGPPLTRELTAGPISPARTMDIVAQVAAALEAAHRAGLVHRDIKPANLLVASGGQVKVTDFGIAHAAGSAPITRSGVLVGTPAYLAPERVAGGPASPASDLYSLGIVAYECLTGAPPFTEGTSFEIAMAHTRDPLPPLPASVPPGVAALVADLTARDPADRPASSGQVAWRARQLLAEIQHPGPPERLPGTGPAAPGPGETLAFSRPDTLVELMPGDGAGRGARHVSASGRRTWTGRRVLLAVACAAALAGLGGWLVGAVGASGSGPQARPGSTRPATSPAVVAVNASALVGQPVRVVVSRLRQLGLRPVVTWVDNGGAPGVVQSVRPAGQVPPGTAVTVIARRPHDHGHDQGGGDQGNGGGGN